MRRIFAILPLDENGSVLVEAAIMAPIIFMLVLGSMDLLFAFYEWNAAAKAVQVGARIAAVSDPVALGLNGLGSAAVSPSSPPGSPMPPIRGDLRRLDPNLHLQRTMRGRSRL